VALQVVQEPQLPVQLVGQGWGLQASYSKVPLVVEQLVPPYRAACVTMNALDVLPPPQEALQVPQLLQAPVQLIGHGLVLHACQSKAPFAAVQLSPPYAAACVTSNVLDWLPPPHVALQVSQAPQLPVQLMGQG
jgi:hypothetical protein